jgi:serine/threonine-protein kinase
MAPEQARGEDLDHRADLYSLCVIAYRALTGRPAFAAQVPAVVMAEVVGRMPPRPSQLADLPDDVDVVLAIGLAKSADDRFASAGELAAAFAAAADGRVSDDLRRRARALADRHPWEDLGTEPTAA